jgi:hypothetical protein
VEKTEKTPLEDLEDNGKMELNIIEKYHFNREQSSMTPPHAIQPHIV